MKPKSSPPSGRANLNAVHLAVLRNSIDELRASFSAGHDVNALDREGRTPLFYTAKDGETNLTSELLQHGANPNVQDINLETPLHFAAREYQVHIAKMLLDAGASVDVQDIHGNTALWRAVYYSRGRGEVIRLLLSRGADKYLPNKHGISPETLANTIASHDVKSFLQ
jgi:uncharacterized protein